MDPGWDRSRGPRPSTSSFRVRELSWQGLHNPCPQSKGPGSQRDSLGEQLVEEYLSPARLQALARVDDLRLVRVLEMCVDTREGSLGNFGVHLPILDQLKLNGSHLGSLRPLHRSLQPRTLAAPCGHQLGVWARTATTSQNLRIEPRPDGSCWEKLQPEPVPRTQIGPQQKHQKLRAPQQLTAFGAEDLGGSHAIGRERTRLKEHPTLFWGFGQSGFCENAAGFM